MNFKGVIFDLDGTLLNTIDDIGDCLNNILVRHGYGTYSMEEYKYLVGNGAAKLVNSALAKNVSKDEEQVILKEYIASLGKSQYNKTKPYDGILEVLSKLNERKIQIGILSNKPQESLTSIVEYYFPTIKFSCVVGQLEGVPIKPDPTSLIQIINNLKLKVEDILYVGDSDVDMETGKEAKVFPLGVTWGFRTKEKLLNHGAKALVESPLEILDVVFKTST